MSNMAIKKRLLTGFIIVALFTTIVGGVAIIGLSTLKTNEAELYDLGVRSDKASMLVANLTAQRVSCRNAIIYMNDETRLEQVIAQLSEQEVEYQELFKFVDDRFVRAESREHIKDIQAANEIFTKQREELLTAAQAGELEKTLQILEEMLKPTTIMLDAAVGLSQVALGVSYDTYIADIGTANGYIAIATVVGVVSVLVAILLGVWNANSIATPIRQLVDAAEQIAQGDVDVEVATNSKDEVGALARSFQKMIDSIREQAALLEMVSKGDYTISVPLRGDKDVINHAIRDLVRNGGETMTNLRSAAAQVAAGAAQIAQGSQGLASGASEQSASIEEFSASLAEIEQATQRSAENSRNAMEVNTTSGELLAQSTESMQQTLQAMREIDESSRSITKVIKVIEDIAFQTNILALNAAVEAARAGQHGKGFAVVADEVRNLASKSSTAAKETGTLIEGSTKKVAEGSKLLETTGQLIENVVTQAHASTEKLGMVMQDTDAQAGKIAEITLGMDQISTVVQANAATAEESAASAEEMSSQSEMLNQIVAKYKLSGSFDALPESTVATSSAYKALSVGDEDLF